VDLEVGFFTAIFGNLYYLMLVLALWSFKSLLENRKEVTQKLLNKLYIPAATFVVLFIFEMITGGHEWTRLFWEGFWAANIL
jgi:hypothetical protein